MAKQREKKTGKPTGLDETGFGEAPQQAFEGVPLGGSVSDWAREIELQAEAEARKAEMREIRSQAGKHRLKAAKGKAADSSGVSEAGASEERAAKRPCGGPSGAN